MSRQSSERMLDSPHRLSKSATTAFGRPILTRQSRFRVESADSPPKQADVPPAFGPNVRRPPSPRHRACAPLQDSRTQCPVNAPINSAAGAASGQAGTPSSSVSQSCFRFTQMCATTRSSLLRSRVPARTTATFGRALFVL